MKLVTRVLFAVAASVLVASALMVFSWAVSTATQRPLDGVEGDVLFEALRIRRGLALYVDPIVGTGDLPPSRYYVVYPPLWSTILSLFASWPTKYEAGAIPGGVVAARLVAYAAFLGSIALAAVANEPWTASEGTAAPRTWARWGVLFALSFFVLTLFGAAARPDSFALLLATLGLVRSLRRREVDMLAGILFAAALLVKPNVMGLAVGTFAASLSLRPRSVVRPMLAGMAVGALAAIVLGIVSGGVFLTHLLRSTAQAPSLSLWGEQMELRLPFVVVPFGIAGVLAWPLRRDPAVRIALTALVSSSVWAVFSLSKIGSASNYWLEPTIATVALLASAETARARSDAPSGPLEPLGDRGALLIGVLVVGQAFYNGVAAIKSATEQMSAAKAKAFAMKATASRCLVSPSDVVLADEPGLELELDGRLVHTAFQMTHLFSAGKLPREPWLADLDRPEVRCVLVEGPELEDPVPWPPEHRHFDPAFRQAILERFSIAIHDPVSGFYLYERRRP